MSGLLSWSQPMQFSQAGDTSVTCLYAFITGTSHSQAMYEGLFRSLNSRDVVLGTRTRTRGFCTRTRTRTRSLCTCILRYLTDRVCLVHSLPVSILSTF